MAIELESPDCPLCGNQSGEVLYEGAAFKPYAIHSCSCGMSYLSPRPTEQAMLALYQGDEYFAGDDEQGYTSYAAQEPALRATFRRLLENLASRHKIGGTLLEIGCGYGYLLDEARPFFTRRVGTDFSAGAVAQASRRADEVLQGGIDAIADAELFDCIIATHVIEHVYYPQDFVKALLQRLRPGGCLLIATPDMGSLWRTALGQRWPSFKLPEHILYFDAHTLRRLLNDCGVKYIKPIPYPHAFPLPLIASKFSLTLPASLNRFSLWIPGTTVAMLAIKND